MPRVLLVEDEGPIALHLASVLIDAGFEVLGPFLQARTAQEALQDNLVDAALLDISLGEETSYRVADTLLAKGVPVLFVTGYGSQGLPERFRGCLHLPKPTPPELLLSRLKKILSGRKHDAALSTQIPPKNLSQRERQ